MATLTQMQERLEALLEARASGIRSVKYGDSDLEYRSDSEISAAIADLERRISMASAKQVSTVYITSSKGLG